MNPSPILAYPDKVFVLYACLCQKMGATQLWQYSCTELEQ